MESEVKVSGKVSVGEKTAGPEAGVGGGGEPHWRNHGLAVGACPFGSALGEGPFVRLPGSRVVVVRVVGIGEDPSSDTPGGGVGKGGGETIGVANGKVPDPRIGEFGDAGPSASGCRGETAAFHKGSQDSCENLHLSPRVQEPLLKAKQICWPEAVCERLPGGGWFEPAAGA